MKTRVLFFLILTTFLSCAQKSEKLNFISQEAFSKLLTSDIQLLDVRTAREFQRGYIKDAILIDFYDPYFVSKVQAAFDKKKPLYIYCSVGGRSNKASLKLVTEGFQEVYNLEGGYSKYQKNNKSFFVRDD